MALTSADGATPVFWIKIRKAWRVPNFHTPAKNVKSKRESSKCVAIQKDSLLLWRECPAALVVG